MTAPSSQSFVAELPAEDVSYPQPVQQRGPPPKTMVTVDGPEAEVLDQCSANSILKFESIWYRHNDVNKFLICTRCQVDYIARSPFSSEFERFQKPSGTPARCHFHIPRIKNRLWPEALTMRSLHQVLEFIKRRLTIPDCPGSNGASADAGIKWFEPSDSRLTDFVACEACYEDNVLASGFANMFRTTPTPQPQDKIWTCDLEIGVVLRAFDAYAPTNVWPSFVAAVQYRAKLPPCGGKPVEGRTLKWLRPRRPIPGFSVCETCFQDRIVLTTFTNEFELIPAHEVGETLLCDFMQISMLAAWEAAEVKKDYTIFWNAANTILRSPRCTGDGIKGGTWYTLAGGCENYDVCAACYAGIIVPTFWPQDSRQFFQVVQHDPNQTLMCDFNGNVPRFLEYLHKFEEAIHKSKFSIFSDHVRKVSSILPCPNMNYVSGRAWYGWKDCVICPECYFAAIDGTALTSQMTFKGAKESQEANCDMYSPRMRGKYAEACATGNVADLVEFSKQRKLIWVQVKTQIKANQDMMNLKFKQSLHYGMLSTQYAGAQSFKLAAGATDGYSYGNSSLGFHSTREGAQSAQYFNMMQQGFSSNNSDHIGTIARLEAMWRAVE